MADEPKTRQPAPRVSIVIPTRDRRAQLAACLRAIAGNQCRHAFELIVVDDGSRLAIDDDVLPAGLAAARIVRRDGEGPAAARNAGVALARGDVVLFTDDDTLPARAWVEATVDYLDQHAEAVAVTGPITSVAWDPLYEQSIVADGPGHHWTANIAYRASVLARIGGFRPDLFRHAHAEDRDLAVRALAIGQIGFSPSMVVDHAPRAIRLRDVARQARWADDDLVLYALHAELTSEFSLPPKLALVAHAGTMWIRGARQGGSAPQWRRWPRALVFCAVSVLSTARVVARSPGRRALRAAAAESRR